MESQRGQRKSFLLRLSAELYDEIRGWAERELRSVNAQIEFLLREAVRTHGRTGAPQEPERGEEPGR
jgi:hypothetical protein